MAPLLLDGWDSSLSREREESSRKVTTGMKSNRLMKSLVVWLQFGIGPVVYGFSSFVRLLHSPGSRENRIQRKSDKQFATANVLVVPSLGYMYKQRKEA